MPSPGRTTDRGYGAEHQALRARWQDQLDAGAQVQCHARHCTRPEELITKHTPWDLGHTDDRTGWTGPEHPGCNRSAGAHKSNGNAEPAVYVPSIDW